MHPLVEEVAAAQDPELLVEQLRGEPGIVLLRSALFDSPQARYSFVTARPFLLFRSLGSRCELSSAAGSQIQFGNPWRMVESLMPRYELLDALDLPFPLRGCSGYWGYDLKNFVSITTRPDTHFLARVLHTAFVPISLARIFSTASLAPRRSFGPETSTR